MRISSLLLVCLSFGTFLQGEELPREGGSLALEASIMKSNLFSKDEEEKKREEEQANCCPDLHYMHAAVRHIEAGGIGYTQGYTTVEGFFANDVSDWHVMPFLDVRGHIFNNNGGALNVGIGARKIWGCRAYGFNFYYDYRSTRRKDFNQIGAGFETLGSLWDLRFNGYLPVGGSVSHPYDAQFAGFSGNFVLVDQKFRFAMKGVDGEIGFHSGKTTNFDFYTAAGAYYFKGHIGKGAVGGKVRASACYKEFVTLELSDSYDTVFHNNFQGQITFSVPFGPKVRPRVTQSCCPDTCDFATTLAMRMTQPVVRQEIIVVDKKKKGKVLTDTSFIFVNNQAHSNGTFESPYPTLVQAQNNSVPGDIIYVYPGDGTTNGMNAGITLQNGQSLWGSGTSHVLSTRAGFITIPQMTPNAPLITNTAGNVVTLAVNNNVSGMNINGSGLTNGIFGTSPGNVSVSHCTISGAFSTAGIDLNYVTGGGNTASFDSLTINNTVYEGIRVYTETTYTGNMNVAVTNSNFTGCEYSMDLEGLNSGPYLFNVNIVNNIVMGDRTYPIYVYAYGSAASPSVWTVTNNQFLASQSGPYIYTEGAGPMQVSLSQNIMTGTVAYPEVYLENGGASTFVMDGNTFNNNGEYAMYCYVEGAQYNVSITNNSFNNNGDYGCYIDLDDALCNATFTNNTFNGNGEYGLYADFYNSTQSTLTIANNTFNNNTDYGFYAEFDETAQGTVMMSNNTFNNNGIYGCYFDNYDVFNANFQSNTFNDNPSGGLYLYVDGVSSCVELNGNSATGNAGLDYFIEGVTPVFVAPCNYQQTNTGIFTLTGTTTIVNQCTSPTVCP